jgi:hypothetical protein
MLNPGGSQPSHAKSAGLPAERAEKRRAARPVPKGMAAPSPRAFCGGKG